MNNLEYEFRARVWLWHGKDADSREQVGGWHFVSVGQRVGERISDEYPWPRRGFGSIRVKVTVGKTKWETSIFPDKKHGFVLPLKKEVREREKIGEGDEVVVGLEIEV